MQSQTNRRAKLWLAEANCTCSSKCQFWLANGSLIWKLSMICSVNGQCNIEVFRSMQVTSSLQQGQMDLTWEERAAASDLTVWLQVFRREGTQRVTSAVRSMEESESGEEEHGKDLQDQSTAIEQKVTGDMYITSTIRPNTAFQIRRYGRWNVASHLAGPRARMHKLPVTM